MKVKRQVSELNRWLVSMAPVWANEIGIENAIEAMKKHGLFASITAQRICAGTYKSIPRGPYAEGLRVAMAKDGFSFEEKAS